MRKTTVIEKVSNAVLTESYIVNDAYDRKHIAKNNCHYGKITGLLYILKLYGIDAKLKTSSYDIKYDTIYQIMEIRINGNIVFSM